MNYHMCNLMYCFCFSLVLIIFWFSLGKCPMATDKFYNIYQVWTPNSTIFSQTCLQRCQPSVCANLLRAPLSLSTYCLSAFTVKMKTDFIVCSNNDENFLISSRITIYINDYEVFVLYNNT